jgi:hypothetical protein
MNRRSDGGSNVIVSFDAFKVSKHSGVHPWRVAPLTRWARRVVKRSDTLRLIDDHRGVASMHPQTFKTMYVDFRTRDDAMEFCRAIENRGD